MEESWKDDTESVLVSYVDIKLAFLLDVYPNLNLVLNSYDAIVSPPPLCCMPSRS